MANEKTLMTRIVNKHADLATWKESSLPLKTGEIALARVETTKPDGNGGFYKVPTYLMKVGDGDKTFSQLEWLAAPASDVYEWAKASVKPSYGATEIARGTSNVSADLTKVEQDIVTLKAAVGEGGSVADAIKAAIEALDVEDAAVANQFVTAVAEADGKISVSRRALEAADIPALGIDKITGLQDALNLKANAADVKNTTDAISARLDENGDIDVAIKAAKKAGDDAQSYAEGVNTTLTTYKTNNDARVKAIEDDYTTAAEAGTIAQGKIDTLVASGQVHTNTEAIATNAAAIAALAGEGNTSTVKANADAIANLEQRIGDVANVMNFRGVSKGATAGADIADPKAGDVIIYGEAEYVYDEAGNWVKFGDASDNATAISELQGRVTNVENDLKSGGATYQSIVAAQAQADKGVQDAKTANDAIAVINGSGDGSIAKAIATATSELQTYADGKASAAQSAAEATAKKYTDDQLKPVTEAATQLAATVSANAETAANATAAVAKDLADYETANDAAVAGALKARNPS